MIEEYQDLNLETDHLDEVIESPPPAQPVVVIQYRSRGVPWYLVVPLLVLVPLGAVAVYHRISSRSRFAFVPPLSVGPSSRNAAEAENGTESLSASSPGAALTGTAPTQSAPADLGAPLALNSQPIAPGSLASVLAQPAARKEETKPAPPGPAATVPVAKTPETSTTATSTELVNAPSEAEPVTILPPPAPVKEPGTKVAATPPVDANRPAPRGAVAVGFSVPQNDDNPFAELAIARGQPGSTTDHEQNSAGATPERSNDPATIPDAQPQPTQEQLLQDIQAEAAEKAAELKERRGIKDRAREVIDSETLARVEDERAAFRRDLSEAVKLSRREAAVQIDNLCDRYGRNYSDDLRSKAAFLLGRYGGKMSREGKVRMLRLAGVPEPGILDFLANETHHMINSRSGPRDSNEVRVDAAKQLLKMMQSKETDGGSKAAPGRRVRPAATAPANSAPGNAQAR